MVVRMCKVLAIPWSWYVCFSADDWYFPLLGLIKFKYSETSNNTFGTFPSVRLIDLIEGVRLIEVGKNCAMWLTINIQRLLRTVIKFHVVMEAKEAVLYFVHDF